MRTLLASLVLLIVACSSGPTATVIGGTDVACTDQFCVEYPDQWQADVGEGFISFVHPADPDRLLATAGAVDMEGVVAAQGGVWPANPEAVARAFWELLRQGVGAGLATVETTGDGWIRTEGAYEGGRLWHLLVPINSSDAFGLEVRAPNTSWETHVDVLFGGFTIIP